MKQNFYFKSLLIALFVLFGGGVIHAAEETITFSKKGYDNAELVTNVYGSKIKIEFKKGNSSNGPAYYDSGTAVRAYGGNSIIVTANDNTITKIVVGFGSSDGSNAITADVGSYSSGTWTGDAKSVTFTIGGTKGNRRIASISVTYTESEQGTGTEDPKNSFAKATDNATVGVPYTVQKITTLSSGRKSYESSDETVATIDNNGNVTLNKAGETTITVTTAADDTYKEGSASYKLIVEKGTPGLSFAQETVTAYLGTDQNGPKLTNPGNGAVTYEISDPSIATIQTNGYIHPIAAGTATVTATTAETDAWLSATASYTLKVEEAFSVDAEGTYEWVKDASTLAAGDELIFVYNGDNPPVAMGPQRESNSNFGETGVGYSDGITDKSMINVSSVKAETVTAIKLEGAKEAWNFHTNNGYLYASSSSSNQLKTATLETAGKNAEASISISEGNATIKFNGSNTRNQLKYNNTNDLFSCYSSGQNTIQIYRKVPSNVPPTVTFSPESGTEVNYGTQVTISARTAKSITYSVNDGEPVTVEGTSATVTINTHSTIKATATNLYGTSEEATAEYTIHAESPAFTYDPDEYTITFGDEFKAPELGKADGYDGTVTFASDNAEVAEVDAETGDVTVKGPGTATITATGTATEHFEEATASYTLTVNKQASAVSFAEPVVEITYGDNYDKQKATAEGFSGDLVYSSSNESVVKFHGNGVIDVLGPGTVTITATAPATETTEESSATYTLKIYEPADAVEGAALSLDEHFDDCEADVPNDNKWWGSNDFKALPDGYRWTVSNPDKAAGNGCLKVGASGGGTATSPSFTLNGTTALSFDIAPWLSSSDYGIENGDITVTLTNATFDDGGNSVSFNTKEGLTAWQFTNKQYVITGTGEGVTIQFGGTARFFLDNVVVGGGAQPAHEINLTFSSAGYLTWVATADIDFTQTTGVTAYKITEATPKKITMVEVDKVAKGEAVMLKGSDTVQLKRTTGAEAFTDNKMRACTDGSVTGNGVGGVTNTDVYVLGNGKNGLGFYMLKGTLQAGKGYLRVTEEAGNAKQSFIGFEVVTGLDAVEAKDADDAAIYNLQGIRVAHPQKGIYVKNGKKYVK